mmetsp:Transcript_85157/g.170116  ORF Transcript_85157/g.170116 Transcript_85157/m.170116 type:complete len:207 (-) Transcript_85157:131-751(-)
MLDGLQLVSRSDQASLQIRSQQQACRQMAVCVNGCVCKWPYVQMGVCANGGCPVLRKGVSEGCENCSRAAHCREGNGHVESKESASSPEAHAMLRVSRAPRHQRSMTVLLATDAAGYRYKEVVDVGALAAMRICMLRMCWEGSNMKQGALVACWSRRSPAFLQVTKSSSSSALGMHAVHRIGRFFSSWNMVHLHVQMCKIHKRTRR